MSTADLITQQGQIAMQLGQTAPKLSKTHNPEEARKAAQDFEAFFIGQMLQPMFENLHAEPPFGGGNAEKIWQSLMVDEYGKAIAKHGGIGIADQVMREILATQEAQ